MLSVQIIPVVLLPLALSSSQCFVHCFQIPFAPLQLCGTNKRQNGRQTFLEMGKGLNRLKGKQAALQKKMEEARRQNRKNDEEETPATALTDEEIKERNDRLRFEQLLAQGSMPNFDNDQEYLTESQEMEEIDAASKLAQHFPYHNICISLTSHRMQCI